MELNDFLKKYGDQLLVSYLRAREDSNQEQFTDWLLAEYDLFSNQILFGKEYEVPYQGICDSPSKAEMMLDLASPIDKLANFINPKIVAEVVISVMKNGGVEITEINCESIWLDMVENNLEDAVYNSMLSLCPENKEEQND